MARGQGMLTWQSRLNAPQWKRDFSHGRQGRRVSSLSKGMWTTIWGRINLYNKVLHNGFVHIADNFSYFSIWQGYGRQSSQPFVQGGPTGVTVGWDKCEDEYKLQYGKAYRIFTQMRQTLRWNSPFPITQVSEAVASRDMSSVVTDRIYKRKQYFYKVVEQETFSI